MEHIAPDNLVELAYLLERVQAGDTVRVARAHHVAFAHEALEQLGKSDVRLMVQPAEAVPAVVAPLTQQGPPDKQPRPRTQCEIDAALDRMSRSVIRSLRCLEASQRAKGHGATCTCAGCERYLIRQARPPYST